jgi:hypothetical protein
MTRCQNGRSTPPFGTGCVYASGTAIPATATPRETVQRSCVALLSGAASAKPTTPAALVAVAIAATAKGKTKVASKPTPNRPMGGGACAPFLRRLRWLFPAEMAGLVVLLVGIVIGSLAVRDIGQLFAAGSDERIWTAIAVTFGTMTVLAVWGTQLLSLLAVLGSAARSY